MADEKEVTAKPEKKAEAICPPFAIRSTVVLNDEAYNKGDEAKLRPLLTAQQFQDLCNLKAITRTDGHR